MYLPAQPIGVNPLNDADRMPLWRVINGDEWALTTRLYVPPKLTEPVNPNNSKISFDLAQDRFTKTLLWTGTWLDGVVEVNRSEHPGLVSIRIPDTVSGTLRRGVYAFSILVSDQFGHSKTTVLVGNIQVEYEPSSLIHNIPYRSGT